MHERVWESIIMNTHIDAAAAQAFITEQISYKSTQQTSYDLLMTNVLTHTSSTCIFWWEYAG